MANIPKLNYSFTDYQTTISAEHLNAFVNRINLLIDAVGEQPIPTQTVETPTISISGTTATISCSTSGATIYYTLNGNTPTTSSTQYSSPITLSGACTIKAIAVKSGMSNSSVASQSYTPSVVAAPVISINSNSATITCATSGATIHYTLDGTTPTASSAQYSSPITLSDACTIKAIAMKSGMSNSQVASQAYTPPVSPYITFADSAVKAILVADSQINTNGDNEISYEEAAAATLLTGSIFVGNTQITSFNELEYFTSITYIATEKFKGCTNLASIKFPNSITDIRDRAFEGCVELSSINLPANLTNLGSGAFKGCTKVNLSSIPNTITEIAVSTFENCTTLTLATLPNSIETIKGSAFKGCTNLALSSLPSGVTYIGQYTFYQCSKVTFSSLPSGITTIPMMAFYACPLITISVIPNGVTSIGNGAFRNCTGLTTMEIPSTITSIDTKAFNGCTGLTKVKMPATPPTIVADSFDNTAVFYVPDATAQAAYASADVWSNIPSSRIKLWSEF